MIYTEPCYISSVYNTERGGCLNTQFKKGIIQLCVMKVVEKKDMYGLEVIETLSSQLDVNENTVYPILRRLTKLGYFETYRKKSNVGPPRKYYRLTNEGKKRLAQFEKEWMSFLSSVMNVLRGEGNE